ncbi:hypothetical protein MiSe_62150 [Microseira wollei NIES-4236]|uniref:PEP-CTERM sorting domain-containing protein n=2 Tax=Microseira wollei TaxID=467598 RepID=A0AAV3XGL2_9CYAN|nr:hypothetical protein MiSe_62150 [Microseira wollei NIES-4236]
MIRATKLSVAALIAMSMSLLNISSADAFTLTKIADNSGILSGFPTAEPAINDSGTVAFDASLKAGGYGIFIGNGGALTPIADTSGIFSSFQNSDLGTRGVVDINNSGTVAFHANLDAGGKGIFTSKDGKLTSIVDTSSKFNILLNPTINNNGTVVFTGVFDGRNNSGVFTGSGGTVNTIADRNGPLAGFGSFPQINNNGTVAFSATLDAGGQGIFTSKDGNLTTVADTTGNFSEFLGSGFNDNDTVLFRALLRTGGQALLTSKDGKLTTIADSSGPFSTFSQAAINNNGNLAFFARLDLDPNNYGLFTGPDPVANKLIATGA